MCLYLLPLELAFEFEFEFENLSFETIVNAFSGLYLYVNCAAGKLLLSVSEALYYSGEFSSSKCELFSESSKPPRLADCSTFPGIY